MTIDLPLDTATPKAARRAVSERFNGERRCEDLILCVSEVVSNAVLHARSAPRLTLRVDERMVRIEVLDDDPTLPTVRPRSAAATTGRGLLILDAIADRWGVGPMPGGKVVWFELDLEGGQ